MLHEKGAKPSRYAMTVKLLEFTGGRPNLKAEIKGDMSCSVVQVLFMLEYPRCVRARIMVMWVMFVGFSSLGFISEYPLYLVSSFPLW